MTDQERRAELMKMLTKSGATQFEANEIIDLGRHASREAAEMVSAVAARGSSPITRQGAQILAFRILITTLTGILEELDGIAHQDLKEAGLDS